ncbi:NAD(P)H-binding protein [Sphingobium sp. Z007]|uniref:NAD(P)H-binding protein n=1 Tax=Sphingobium sp. Z007 TaxID=627495 RepID=UPI000B4A144E|nr:NAD(P)H-binding protein [Sphingobium sp. Z007]
MTHILLAGATGLVGGAALARLLDDDRVTQVVAPTRRPLAPHPKLLNPLVDSRTLPRDAPWWTVDAAICALGTTRKKAGSAEAFRAVDHDYVLAIAAQVRRSGARRFALTSSMGADSHSPFLYPRTKGEVEAAVRQLAFPSLTILRPGLLGGDRTEHRPMERIMGRLLRIAGPILPASARISPAATVAQLLVAAALDGQPGTHVITAADIARAAVL